MTQKNYINKNMFRQTILISFLLIIRLCSAFTISASSRSSLNPPSLLPKHLRQVQDYTNNRFRYSDSSSIIFVDVLSHSICLERVGGLLETIIPRNTLLPTMKTRIFTTYSDSGGAPRFSLFEGDHGNFSHSISSRSDDGENRLIGRYEIYGIAPAPRGVPQIEVRFSVDEDGILNVSARDRSDVFGREKLRVVEVLIQ